MKVNQAKYLDSDVSAKSHNNPLKHSVGPALLSFRSFFDGHKPISKTGKRLL